MLSLLATNAKRVSRSSDCRLGRWQERKKKRGSDAQGNPRSSGTAAEVAVFGTLSETYRTCGRAGCHSQQGGPKHGPHLNVSYRAENGKTTGYYVPQAAAEATRQGVAPGKNCKTVCANWES